MVANTALASVAPLVTPASWMSVGWAHSDETMTKAAIDVSGRPFLVWNVAFSAPKIGTFDTELVREFFQALSTHGGITLHVDKLHGFNSHHIAEATFKSVARALRQAVEQDPRLGDALPSTKGAL